VVVRAGARAEAAELVQFCGQHLVRYKVPSEFQFVAELPKTTVGKIDRKRLKELS
jgi:acyl-CoA synthetase (AMP-forming)/AMP-acid ligase II